jgi:hypothetical protein
MEAQTSQLKNQLIEEKQSIFFLLCNSQQPSIVKRKTTKEKRLKKQKGHT